MSDAQRLAELIRLGDSIHPDELTDEALTCLTETLARYARKYLPEGYVLRLDCSAYAHEVTLLKVTDVKAGGGILEMTQVNGAEDHWGKACDYAIQNASEQRIQRAIDWLQKSQRYDLQPLGDYQGEGMVHSSSGDYVEITDVKAAIDILQEGQQ